MLLSLIGLYFLKQSEAEICIGAFVALTYVLKAIAFASSPLALDFLVENYKSKKTRLMHFTE